ncbi:uracil-DNA glycosylase [Patescibacteria group bacterium]|nr:uracil-DNA glycosylase [Patescibacteria group bacterium]MBU2633093.1 uracil-DNA glycosylase [Patescibacteria group bacterium]
MVVKNDNRIELLRKIKDEVVGLKESFLCQERIKNGVFPVLGEGNHYAEIMFIGEAPGKNEVATGRPFCGASGRVLDELLAHISLDRKNVYVTNIVKDRPPLNRDPRQEEIDLYASFLDRQISVIQPKVIVALGRFSMEYLMKRFGLKNELDSIGKIHGRKFEMKTDYGTAKFIPLYHPAVALYNAKEKDTLKKDFEVLII